MPQEAHSPGFAKSVPGKYEEVRKPVKQKGVTGLTSQWVSGRDPWGQPSIGPLQAGVAGRARPGHRLQLCPDPRTHRNCMAATLPTPVRLCTLSLLVAPWAGRRRGRRVKLRAVGDRAGAGAPGGGRGGLSGHLPPSSPQPWEPRKDFPHAQHCTQAGLGPCSPFPSIRGPLILPLHPTPCFFLRPLGF